MVYRRLRPAVQLDPVLNTAGTGYSVVYHIEIYLLFATLVALGPFGGKSPSALCFRHQKVWFS